MSKTPPSTDLSEFEPELKKRDIEQQQTGDSTNNLSSSSSTKTAVPKPTEATDYYQAIHAYLTKIAVQIEGKMKEIQYFQLNEEQILEKQKENCPKLVNILEHPYPPSSYNVTLPNFLFSKRVIPTKQKYSQDQSGEGKKQPQKVEKDEISESKKTKNKRKNMAKTEQKTEKRIEQATSSKIEKEEIETTEPFHEEIFDFNQVLPGKKTFFQQEDPTAQKVVEIILQARGFGKTHYLLSHAVTDDKPTVYIDLAKLQERILYITVSRIETEIAELRDRNSKTKIAVKYFQRFIMCKIMYFLAFLRVNSPKKPSFADFLRISMPNNYEMDTYLEFQKIQVDLLIQIEKFGDSNVFEFVMNDIKTRFGTEKVFLAIDEFGDMSTCEICDDCFEDRNLTNVGKGFHHPFTTALLQFLGCCKIQIAGTSGSSFGTLGEKQKSSFLPGETVKLSLGVFGKGDEFLKIVEPFVKKEMITDDLRAQYYHYFSFTRPRFVVETIFARLNVSKLEKDNFLTITEKDLYNAKQFPQYYLEPFLDNEIMANRICNLFLFCLTGRFQHLFNDTISLDHLIYTGLLSFGESEGVYFIEKTVCLALRDFYFGKKGFGNCIDVLFANLNTLKENKQKGEAFEILEGFLLCYSSFLSKKVKENPFFQNLVPTGNYPTLFSKLEDLKKCKSYLASFQKRNFDSFNFSSKQVLQMPIDNFAGPDKAFILLDKNEENTSKVLVLIQEKFGKVIDFGKAIKSVWLSKLEYVDKRTTRKGGETEDTKHWTEKYNLTLEQTKFKYVICVVSALEKGPKQEADNYVVPQTEPAERVHLCYFDCSCWKDFIVGQFPKDEAEKRLKIEKLISNFFGQE